MGVAETIAELQAEESLSLAEYLAYEDELNAQFGKIGASINQLEAVTKKFGDTAPEVVATEVAITTTLTTALEAQDLLDSIVVIEEVPGVPVEEPTEEQADTTTESVPAQ